MAWWKRQKAAPRNAQTRHCRSSASRASPRSSRATPARRRRARARRRHARHRAAASTSSVSGPSGCGKSTFLSILALLDAPTERPLLVQRPPRGSAVPGEKARIRNVDVGLIFQSFNLIGDMTVYENVEYPLTLRGVAGRRAQVARRRGARPRRARGARQAAARVALGRPPAARRHRARDRRPPADRPGRRADRQPRLEERRSGDADARRAARRRRDDLPRHPQPATTSPGRSATSTCSTAASRPNPSPESRPQSEVQESPLRQPIAVVRLRAARNMRRTLAASGRHRRPATRFQSASVTRFLTSSSVAPALTSAATRETRSLNSRRSLAA